MDNIINAQTSAKTLLKTVSMISAIALVLSITPSNVNAVDPDQGWHDGQCDPPLFYPDKTVYICCWTETEEDDPEKIEINKCQRCEVPHGGVINCDPPFPDPTAPPTTKEDISPENTGGIEQPPPKTNEPPIKSGDSVAPIDDSNSIDEQQPNSNSPAIDQRVPPGNVGGLEQLDDSSNNQNSEPEDSVSSDNSGLFNVVPQNP